MQILLETRCNCRRIVTVSDKYLDKYMLYHVPLVCKVVNPFDETVPNIRSNTRDFRYMGNVDLATGLLIFEEES